MKTRHAGLAVVVANAVLILLATLTPAPAEEPMTALCIICGRTGGVDAVLNVSLFGPLGFGFALAGIRLSRALASGFVLTTLIEVAQLTVVVGRDASIGDVLANLVGCWFGFAVGRNYGSLLRPSRRAAIFLTLGSGALFVFVQILGAYALIPRRTEGPYYGQLGSDLVVPLGLPDSTSHVLVGQYSVSGGHMVPESIVTTSQIPRVRARVMPRICPEGNRRIVRIVDPQERTLLVLAQRRSDVFFAVRTGADAMRLRPVRYRMERAFDDRGYCDMAMDTVEIESWVDRMQVNFRITVNGSHRDASVPREAVASWRLIAPWQTYAADRLRDRLLTGAWILVLLFPMFYWATMMFGSGPAGLSLVGSRVLALPLGVAVIGFWGIPTLFSLPPARFAYWVATFAAVLVAHSMARRLGRT